MSTSATVGSPAHETATQPWVEIHGSRGFAPWLRGEFGRVNLETSQFEPLAFCPSYLRGMTFIGDSAIVSLSQPRHDKTFNGLGLDAELSRRDAVAQCGLQVIDLNTGDIKHWLKVENTVSEIYDVVALPGSLRPMELGLKNDEIERLLVLDNPGRLRNSEAHHVLAAQFSIVQCGRNED